MLEALCCGGDDDDEVMLYRWSRIFVCDRIGVVGGVAWCGLVVVVVTC